MVSSYDGGGSCGVVAVSVIAVYPCSGDSWLVYSGGAAFIISMLGDNWLEL